MVRKDRHVLDELLDEDSPLDIVGGLPDAADIEIAQCSCHLLEPSSQLIELQVLLPTSRSFSTHCFDLAGELVLFLSKQFRRDSVCVVETTR